MCVAAIAWQAHPRWRLVAASNRDEFQDRPSAPLTKWDKGIIAGRDLRGGGTWLGVHPAGRFALVTNFRVPEGPQPGRPSRGALVTDLLEGMGVMDADAMNPFNLACVSGDTAHFIANHSAGQQDRLQPGIHGLSNGSLSAPWPKTDQLCDDLRQWLGTESDDLTPLFTALRRESPDKVTDHGPEQRLAPVFIRDPVYGTRCSTVVAVDYAGAGRIIERSFDPLGNPAGEAAFDFVWPATP